MNKKSQNVEIGRDAVNDSFSHFNKWEKAPETDKLALLGTIWYSFTDTAKESLQWRGLLNE